MDPNLRKKIQSLGKKIDQAQQISYVLIIGAWILLFVSIFLLSFGYETLFLITLVIGLLLAIASMAINGNTEKLLHEQIQNMKEE